MLYWRGMRLPVAHIDTEHGRIHGRQQRVSCKLAEPIFRGASPWRVGDDGQPQAAVAVAPTGTFAGRP